MARRELGVVGDEQNRLPVPMKLGQEIHYLIPAVGVESARGLIGQEQGRFVDQGACDGDPLLLSAAQLRRVAIGDLSDAEWDCLQRVLPPRSPHGRLRRHCLRSVFDALRPQVRQRVSGLAHPEELDYELVYVNAEQRGQPTPSPATLVLTVRVYGVEMARLYRLK